MLQYEWECKDAHVWWLTFPLSSYICTGTWIMLVQCCICVRVPCCCAIIYQLHPVLHWYHQSLCNSNARRTAYQDKAEDDDGAKKRNKPYAGPYPSSFPFLSVLICSVQFKPLQIFNIHEALFIILIVLNTFILHIYLTQSGNIFIVERIIYSTGATLCVSSVLLRRFALSLTTSRLRAMCCVIHSSLFISISFPFTVVLCIRVLIVRSLRLIPCTMLKCCWSVELHKNKNFNTQHQWAQGMNMRENRTKKQYITGSSSSFMY